MIGYLAGEQQFYTIHLPPDEERRKKHLRLELNYCRRLPDPNEPWNFITQVRPTFEDVCFVHDRLTWFDHMRSAKNNSLICVR